MKYRNAIITFGILTAIILSPFIGIPRSWKEGVAIIFALCISTLAYLSNRTKPKLPVSAAVASPAEQTTSNPQ